MAQQQSIQGRIYAGYAKAAGRIGAPAGVYRPVDSTGLPQAPLATILASFNNCDFTYRRTNKFGDPYNYGVFDGRQTMPGDYLVADDGTYFVASQSALLPILVCVCNDSVRIGRRPPASSQQGVMGYGGTDMNALRWVAGTDTSYWPASVLSGGTGLRALEMPEATRQDGFKVLLPVSLQADIRPGDIVVLQSGRRLAITSPELSPLGWRLSATEVHV